MSQWTPLHHAICHRQFEAAKYLLSRGASVFLEHHYEPDEWKRESWGPTSAAHLAAGMGDVATLMEISRLFPDFSFRRPDRVGFAPLDWALRNGRWDTSIKWLVAQGISVDEPSIDDGDRKDLTPLASALFWRHYGDAEALLELGANPHARGKEALHCLCRHPLPIGTSTQLNDGPAAVTNELVEEQRSSMILRLLAYDADPDATRSSLENFHEIMFRRGHVTVALRCAPLGTAILKGIPTAVRTLLGLLPQPQPIISDQKIQENPSPRGWLSFYLAVWLAGMRDKQDVSSQKALTILWSILEFAHKAGYGVECANSALHMVIGGMGTCAEDNRALDFLHLPMSPPLAKIWYHDSKLDHKALMELLFSQGANPFSLDSSRASALQTAYEFEAAEFFEIMVAKVAPTDEQLLDVLTASDEPLGPVLHNRAFKAMATGSGMRHNIHVIQCLMTKALEWYARMPVDWHDKANRFVNIAQALLLDFLDAGSPCLAQLPELKSEMEKVLILACALSSGAMAGLAVKGGANVNVVTSRSPDRRYGGPEISPLLAAIFFAVAFADGRIIEGSLSDLAEFLLLFKADVCLRLTCPQPVRSGPVTASPLEWAVKASACGPPSCREELCWVVERMLHHNPDCLRAPRLRAARGHDDRLAVRSAILGQAIMPNKKYPWLPCFYHCPISRDMIQLLISRGADPATPDDDGDTPLGLLLHLLLDNATLFLGTRLGAREEAWPTLELLVRDLLSPNLDFKLGSATDARSLTTKIDLLVTGKYYIECVTLNDETGRFVTTGGLTEGEFKDRISRILLGLVEVVDDPDREGEKTCKLIEHTPETSQPA